jgi:triacylglycerol esterase/lipase EstA (alpha/beta hydrolase family)
MTCTACAKAAAKVSHEFTANCLGCCARACARGPDFQRVRKQGVQDHQYRLALQHFGLTHDQVKAAAAADKGNKP